MAIKIDTIKKEVINGRVRISSNIYINNTPDKMFFETEEKDGKYLCEENGDAFLMGILLWAMKNHSDIYIKPPISERFLYGITKILMPELIKMNPELGNIVIYPEKTVNKDHKIINGVVTPISCGVDSFYTVLSNNGNDIPETMRLTHLVLFNAGAYGDDTKISEKEFFQYMKYVQPVCKKLELPLIWVNSNLMKFFPFYYVQIHTFYNISCALALQKLIKFFYYSSTFMTSDFEMKFLNSSYYELLIGSALKTEGFEMISFGGEISRFQKVEKLHKKKIFQKHLNVCVKPEEEKSGKVNCSLCHKCIRTMAALDIIGCLPGYKDVFDIDIFYKNKTFFWGRIRNKGWRTNLVITTELLEAAKKYKYRVPILSFFWMYIISIKNLTRRQFKRIKK
ncbi:hypothetical protein M0P98_03375 [bacterium]|nr:hypothetical protein [bacterium]